MIHRTDEQVFRFVELTCYWSLILGVPILKFTARKHDAYFMPVLFVILGSVGLVFLTRHFIYANPHHVFDRTRAQTVVLTTRTKIALFAGYAMSLPMFSLGCLGMFSPALMERTITAISPMQFILR